MMNPQDHIASMKVQYQLEVQTIIKQLPSVTDPSVKNKMEYQKAQLLFKIQELYTHEMSRTVPMPCGKCGAPEVIALSKVPLWVNNGSQCMVCWLNEFWEKNPGL